MPMKGPCPVMVNIPPRLAALLLVNTPPKLEKDPLLNSKLLKSAVGAISWHVPLFWYLRRKTQLSSQSIYCFSWLSAGGTGVLLNIERVASQLQQLGAEAQVRGLVDSGWFLESKQQQSPNCPETVSCSPEDAIKMGLRYLGLPWMGF